jgi:hypothetical protein
MLLSAAMNGPAGAQFQGLFTCHAGDDGRSRLARLPQTPLTLSDPDTGRHLEIATIDVGATAICPECDRHSLGGFISFVSDLRVVYACPECEQLVWIRGA